MSERRADDQSDGTMRRWALPRMIASAPWVVILVGAAVLVVLLVVAALSFRGPEQPAAWAPGPPMLLPVPPESTGSADPSNLPESTPGPGATEEPSAAPPGSATPSPSSPSVSSVPSLSGTAAPRADAGRSPTASTPASPTADTGVLAASYRLQSADGVSFQAELVVRNGTGEPVDWQVDLSFTAEVSGIRASSGPGVSVSIKGGGRYLLSGNQSLAPGAQQSVQLRISRTGGGEYPTGCTVNGAACMAG